MVSPQNLVCGRQRKSLELIVPVRKIDTIICITEKPRFAVSHAYLSTYIGKNVYEKIRSIAGEQRYSL